MYTMFQKKGVNYTNEKNGFEVEGKKRDFLQLCKIVSSDKKIVLLGIHWATQISNWKRTKDFAASLSRLMPDASKHKILLFGDTNANPDIKFEKSNDEETYINNMEKYITNCLFESQMKCSGLKEIFPSATDDKNNYNTTNFGKDGTRIDRVFTNIPGVTVEVKRSFLKNKLSDHAALVITFDEEKLNKTIN